MRPPSNLTGLFLGSLLLAGCAAGPDLGVQPRETAGAIPAASVLARAGEEGAWPGDHWWRGYGDAQLAALIEEGLEGGPDVSIAAARLRAADSFQRQALAALVPVASSTASAGGAKQSYNNGIPPLLVPHGWNDTGLASLSFSYDLDFWGKNRAALRAATSDSEASRLELAQARLVLSTNIATAYAELARLTAERDIQTQAVQLRLDTRKLTGQRVENGLDTRAELKQADIAVATAQSDLAALDASIGLTRNRIAALLGKGPDRGHSIARPAIVSETQGLPRDVATDLIGRRPDIAAARARAEAAAERVKAAHADFYPSVSLQALIGVQSLGLSNLLKSGSSYGNATPAVSLPIFNGGRVEGQYRAARASYEEAVATYDRTVAGAYQEVADAVTSRAAVAEQLSRTREALAAAEDAYGAVRDRFGEGVVTYLAVLTAQDSELQHRRALAELQSQAFTLDIALVRALGGGLISPPSAHTAGEQTKDHVHGLR